MANTERIGDLFVTAGLITADDIPKIEQEATSSGTRFASAAVRLGLLSEQEVLRFLAVQHGVPAVDLTRCIVRREVLDRIPGKVAARESILPLRVEQNNLLLAMNSPNDTQTRDEIAFVTGLSVLPYVAMRDRLGKAIQDAYGDNADWWRGPRAQPESADEGGYVAIVTQAPLPMPEEISMEVEVEVMAAAALVDETPAKPGFAHWAGESKPTVVVIDDEPEILRLVIAALRVLDVNVASAETGLTGLLTIKQHDPDLVVVDAMLPEVHGFEIVRKLKESKRFRDTPVLMISAIYRGWRVAEDIKATYEVDVFMEKPFRVAELRHQVTQLLERKRKTPHGDLALPGKVQELYNRALELYGGNDFDEAFKVLREAESLEPFSSKIQFVLARTLERRERPLQAIYHYERAVELEPKLFPATKNLALLYQNKGFRNKAIEMWERSLRAAPNDNVRDQIKKHLVSFL